MKYLKVLIGILIAGCLGLLVYLNQTKNVEREEVKWQEETSQSLLPLYKVKKAEVSNSQKIQIFYNNQLVAEDENHQNLYMDEDMNILGTPEYITKIFRCTVDVVEDDLCQITWGTKIQNVPTYLYRNLPYISIKEICEAFGQAFTFDEVRNSGWIKSNLTIVQSELMNIPAYYDLRDEQRAPQVQSQGSYGTCWAFATVGAMESTLLPWEELHLSVDHLTMNNDFNLAQTEGGDFLMALSYLASWKGPVKEEDDPYGDGVTDASLAPVKHMQGAICIQPQDYAGIKKALIQYGGVQSSFYSDIQISNQDSDYYNMQNASYFYDGTIAPNHDILIIGWDDDYPKENFNITPEHDGAFICQNSWGTDFGQGGCFYISYDDTNIGSHNIVYTRIDDCDNYQQIYQADRLGWLGNIGYGESEAWFSNVYTSGGMEKLSAVSFYTTAKKSKYEVYAVPEYTSEDSLENRIFLKSGNIEDSGYHTVDFPKGILVHGPFAVVVHIYTENEIHPVAIEYVNETTSGNVELADGHGYISYDGKNWQSAEDKYECNICLKAFTNNI